MTDYQERQQPFNPNPSYGTVPSQSQYAYYQPYPPTYPPNTYPPNTYPPNTYPPNAYPPNTYPPNTYPPNTYPPPNTYGESQQPMIPKSDKGDNTRFNYDQKKWRDAIWAILFYMQLIGMIGLSIYYYSKNSNNYKTDHTSFVNGDFWWLTVVVAASGFGSAAIWILFIKKFSYYLIWFCLIFSLAVWIAFSILFFVVGSVVGCIICLIFAALQGLWMYCVRHRIRFASVVLKLAIEAINLMPVTYLISFLSIFVQATWILIWIMGVAFVLYDQQSSSNNNNTVVFLLLVSFYWTAQVIANVVHVTAAGCVATWYFLYPSSMPSSPVWGAFKRSTTTSFGSICLGSLIIAIVEAMKAMLQGARRSGNSLLKACAECLLNCIENLINYFNLYAFTHVAIYGYSYCTAAKETWHLIKSKGMDMVINDDLIGPVLVIACLLAGALCAGVTLIITKYSANVQDWGTWTVVGFFVGYALTLCSLVIVRSGVATIFVCFAEDPAALQSTKPETYTELTDAWKERFGAIPKSSSNQNQNQ